MNNHRLLLVSLTTVILGAPVYADTTIELSVTEENATKGKSQTALIKDGIVFVKSAGGDRQTDLYFDSQQSVMTVINHGDRSYLTFTEKKVGELADQAQGMMSIVQKQLAENLANLPPEQAARVKEMMGNLGVPPTNQPPSPAKELVERGVKTVNKIKCRLVDIISNNRKLAQICMADRADLNLPPGDYEAIRAMLEFGKRISKSTRKFSNQIGETMPDLSGLQVDGVPVEVRDFTGPASSTMTVTRISAGVNKAHMIIPVGYKERTLPSLPRM